MKPDRLARATLSLLVILCMPRLVSAQMAAETFVSGLSNPVGIVQDPTDATVQFVVEQAGHIRVIKDGILQATDFLDLHTAVFFEGERGLLGLAFAPDYATSRRFFVNFINTDSNTVVARFKRSNSSSLVADPGSRLDLQWPSGNRFIEQPFTNHNGGNLAFGSDGYLYIGLGDGGGSNDPYNLAQDPSSLLGKMLRIDVNVPDSNTKGYQVPPDNPFPTGSVAAPAEVWAFGLRNPWRYSFDDMNHGGTGALIIADVGQSSWEEIDYEPRNMAGRNYGWRNREGAHDRVTTFPPGYTPLTEPTYEYDHSVGYSITGGYVYRGAALGAEYVGRYFYGDFGSGHIWSLGLAIDSMTGEATTLDVRDHTNNLGGPVRLGHISTFGVDQDGELLVANYYDGLIKKIVGPAGTATLVGPSGTAAVTKPTYTWKAGRQASWYYLWLQDSVGTVFTQWYQAIDLGCGAAAGQCSVTPDIQLEPGEVQWWVRSWNAVGALPWSNGLSFMLPPVSAATLTTPTGVTTTTTPSYVWNAVSGAAQYYLWVDDSTGTRVRNMYSADDAHCGSGTGTCSVNAAVSLAGGSARWWIQTLTRSGAAGPWSDSKMFEVTVPPAPTLVAPTGTIIPTSPAYRWNAVAGATWYWLWVDDRTGTRVQQWYTASQANCASASICAVSPMIDLVPSTVRWWVKGWNDVGAGPWSSPEQFMIAVAMGVAPSGSAGTSTPVYRWNAVPNSTWYQLWVEDSTGPRVQQWFTASQAGCGSGAGECAVTPTVALASGMARWWVKTWNDEGSGPWNAPLTFSVP